MQLLTHPLYLSPIPLYVHIYGSDKLLIDGYTPFVKQTFRNRTVIATERGIQALTIPIIHNGIQAMRDVRISEHGNWRHQHWNAIESAYRKSPFFDYYADDFAHFYEEKDGFLMDFNLRLHAVVCDLLSIDIPVEEVAEETKNRQGDNISDMRHIAEPKSSIDKDFPVYYQVFAERNGFIPDLSIVDLLFNMGPEGLILLEKQAKKLNQAM